MQDPKELVLQVIEAQARHRVGRLAYRLIRAPSEQREVVLAEMEFDRWLAETCAICLRRNCEEKS